MKRILTATLLFAMLLVPIAARASDLFDAIQNDDLPAVRTIVQGAPQTVQSRENVGRNSGLTPMLLAAALGRQQIVSYLLMHGARLDERSGDGMTAMHMVAIPTGAGAPLETASYLIGRGANVNARDNAGHTPLFYAVKYDNKRVAALLRQKGGQ